jgi:hypothetical protein
VAAAALAVALLIRLPTLDSIELATAPADDVALAATEPSDDVADAMFEATEERRVVCEPMAVPAAEVSELASEMSEESASEDWAETGVKGVERRKRRLVVEAREKRILVFGTEVILAGWLAGWLVFFNLVEVKVDGVGLMRLLSLMRLNCL